MSKLKTLMGAAALNAPATSDPNFNQVVYVSNFENKLAFQDESANKIPLSGDFSNVTPNLNTPFGFGTIGGSIFANGNGNLIAPYSSNFVFTGDFTVELYVYVNSCDGYSQLINSFDEYSGNGWSLSYLGSNTQLYFVWNGTNIVGPGTVNYNTWNHVAVVRQSGTITLYINGGSVGSASDSSTIDSGGYPLTIYGTVNSTLTQAFYSNIRILNGTAAYSGNFSPPTLPYVADINTTFLLTGNGQAMPNNDIFVDQGPYGTKFSKSNSSSPQYSGASPFGNKFPGSVYFDGGNYLQGTQNYNYPSGSADFTIEAWVFVPTGTTGSRVIVSGQDYDSLGFRMGRYSGDNPNNGLGLYQAADYDAEYCNYNFNFNTWYHVAVTRTAGTIYFFVNGQQQTTQNTGGVGSNSLSTTSNIYCGCADSTGEVFLGNISNLRILSGLALYTSNFTPSATPLLPINNTVLLMRGDTGAFYDLSNNDEMVQIASQKIFYIDASPNNLPISLTSSGSVLPNLNTPFTNKVGGSLYFNGGGDLVSPYNSNFVFTGDFTVEFFINPQSLSGLPTLFGCCNSGDGVAGWQFYIDSSTNQIFWLTNGPTLGGNSSSVAPNNTWTHIAVTRSYGTEKLFVNGNLVDSVSSQFYTIDSLGTNFIISGNSGSLKAFYSNIRILNGTALYTANFTPPTAPLTAIANTSLLITGTNQGQDNDSTFIDQGPLALPLNYQGANGTPEYQPLNPFPGQTGSMYFNAGFLQSGSNIPAMDFGQNDFTIEWWMYSNDEWQNNYGSTGILSNRNSGNGWVIYSDGNYYDKMNLRISDHDYILTNTTPAQFEWEHWAVVRHANTINWYHNGALDSSTPFTSNVSDSSANFAVAESQPWDGRFYGYLSNIRIVNGTAVYTGNTFRVPTEPLEAIANTVFLMRGDTGYLYNQPTIQSIPLVTGTGQPVLSANTSKFGTQSLYLDGNSYVVSHNRTELNFNNNDFTIEAWVYPTADASTSWTPIISVGIDRYSAGQGEEFRISQNINGQGYGYLYPSGGPWWNGPGFDGTTSTANTLPLNTWTHMAMTRTNSAVNDAAVHSLYVNGKLMITNPAGNIPTVPLNLYLGGDKYSDFGYNDGYFQGYLDDIRITSGVSRYGQFSPPKGPLASTANTELLALTTSNLAHDASSHKLALTNTGVTYMSGANNTPFPLMANQGSGYFNGSSSFIKVPATTGLVLPTANTPFTIEAWVNITHNNPGGCIFSDTWDGNNMNIVVSLNNGGGIDNGTQGQYVGFGYIQNNSGWQQMVSTNWIPYEQWTHVACVFDGSAAWIYLNGVMCNNGYYNQITSWSTSASNQGWYIGRRWDTGGTPYFGGNISNLRVVIGEALYTTNFTPSPITLPLYQ